MNDTKTINIGGAAGAWGDSALATPQLLASKKLDYIMYEALAEITMAILTRAKMKNPQAGYAIDFIDPILKHNLREIRRQGIRVITNAGGINPQAAANALREIASAQGIELKIAVVEGDDLMAQSDELRASGLLEMATQVPIPERLFSFNAYLGAFPIAAALAAGADVVITGRVVDSALVLGPLIHEFGWSTTDYDKLAQGSLAGHLLECGPQSTGGLLTDWESVASWVNMGYPIAECHADGSFVLTKADGTDGIVNRKSATEQILYEIGDPCAYMLPDVVCDFSQIQLTEIAPDRVLVEGARGKPAPSTYKACALEPDGYRLQFMAMIGGRDAARKAQRVGEAIIEHTRQAFKRLGMADFRDTLIETLGGESTYGPHSRARAAREVILKVGAHHDNKHALAFFAREIPSIGLSMAQGITGGGAGRARPAPFIRVHSFLIPRESVTISVTLDGEVVEFNSEISEFSTITVENSSQTAQTQDSTANIAEDSVEVPLIRIAYGRSGDKGDICNVGIAARHPDFVPIIAQQLTAANVKQYLAHLVKGEAKRYELPGLHAFNFVLYEALGGGGTASLRYDPQGKAMAQMVLDYPIFVPNALLAHPAFHA